LQAKIRDKKNVNIYDFFLAMYRTRMHTNNCETDKPIEGPKLEGIMRFEDIRTVADAVVYVDNSGVVGWEDMPTGWLDGLPEFIFGGNYEDLDQALAAYLPTVGVDPRSCGVKTAAC
jgi:hypothetical protein